MCLSGNGHAPSASTLKMALQGGVADVLAIFCKDFKHCGQSP